MALNVISSQPTVSNLDYCIPTEIGASGIGLEIFRRIKELVIQQTTNGDDSIAENRYIVKIPKSFTIAYATEASEGYQRSCFGSSRGFNMRLYDITQREVLLFKRRLAFGYCPFCCYLQEMEVWISPEKRIGKICQSYSLSLKTEFKVFDDKNTELFLIRGPSSLGGLLGKSQHFQIFSVAAATSGSIIYQWDKHSSNHTILQIPDQTDDNCHKALLLGSAFLLDYMYFENLRSRSCRRCFC